MKKNKGWCWFCHHDIMLEYCTDFADRVKYIEENKPANEVSIRLNAFRFVKGKLPKELLKAYVTYDKARVAYHKIHAAFDKAGVAYNKTCVAYNKTGAAYNKARAACDKARAIYDKTHVVYNKAYTVYKKACAAYDETYIVCSPQIIALFKKECPDIKWDEENQTLKF